MHLAEKILLMKPLTFGGDYRVTLLAPHFTWIDRARSIELALVHDEPEIVTGDKDPVGEDGQGTDTHAFNRTRRLDKDREERRALDALTSSMRYSQRESYRCRLLCLRT